MPKSKFAIGDRVEVIQRPPTSNFFGVIDDLSQYVPTHYRVRRELPIATKKLEVGGHYLAYANELRADKRREDQP